MPLVRSPNVPLNSISSMKDLDENIWRSHGNFHAQRLGPVITDVQVYWLYKDR